MTTDRDDYVRARVLTLRETIALETIKSWTREGKLGLRADVVALKAVHLADCVCSALQLSPEVVADRAQPKGILGAETPRPVVTTESAPF